MDVRGIVVGLLVIAACYAPSVAPGTPCAQNGLCPQGQACVAGVCVLPGGAGDAGTDGGDALNPDDRDGDGVLNSADNCPDVANADQANEDGDRFGDKCDPCPTDRNDTPSDPDGDGVADSCDPNPTTPGDAIELFEGFRQGLPAWTSGRSFNWAAGTGEVIRVTASINDTEWLVLPAMSADRVTVSASVLVEQLTGSNIDHEIGFAMPYEASTYSGISCDLVDDMGRFIGMWDEIGEQQVGSTNNFTWADNTEYRVAMVHRGTNFTCTVIEPNAMAHTTTGTSSSPVGMPVIALRAYALTARVSWVMIVRSP